MMMRVEVLIYSLLVIGTLVLVTIIIVKRKKHEDRKRKELENFIDTIFKNTGSKLEVKTLSAGNLKATEIRDIKNGDKEDIVNDPQHYKLDGLGIESIDVIKSVLGDEFKAFCKGNVLKYVMRADKKNGVEDLKKAKVYLEWLLENE